MDDDRAMLDMVGAFFKKRGYAVLLAEGCEEALQKISEADFDLAFVDVNLSDVDGIELINEIRKTFPDISIVAMTGNSSREMEIRVREQRVICFLIKPFETKEVYYIVDHVLKRKSQALTRGNTISRGY